ncbi:hypothetical protein BH20ACT15_BH20ACT15_04970 [soil metagenome]
MKVPALIAALSIAALGLAACGGDDDGGSDSTSVEATTEATTEATDTAAAGGGGGAGGTVDLSAVPDGSFAYEQDSAETTAGSVTVNFDNPAALSHDVVIEDDGGTIIGETELVSEEKTSATVDLQPGTYTFFCDVPGHREGGMEGTLTVK